VGQFAVEAEVTLVERLPVFRRRARAPSDEERRRDARGGHVPLAACQSRPGPFRIRRRRRQYRRATSGNRYPLQLLLLLYPQRALLRYRCPLQRDLLRSFLKRESEKMKRKGEEER